jgi:hypothetical protein
MSLTRFAHETERMYASSSHKIPIGSVLCETTSRLMHQS